jgi:muconate cycloisomerase
MTRLGGLDQPAAGSRDMRIASVRVHQLIVPMRAGAVHSAGVDDSLCAPDPVTGRELNFWEFPKWIVELVADNGLVGLGEPRRGDLLEPLCRQAEMIVGRTLAELPVGDLPLPHGDAYDSYIVYEAFEMAWLDLLGQHWGVPVHHLLGGKRSNAVPIDFWMGRMSAEDTRLRTRLAVEMGFTGLKMKCTLDDPIAERVTAVREIAPHFSIVLDPNERFGTPESTQQVARSLEAFDRIVFESPMPQHRLDWYVMMRGAIPQPIALHLTELRELQAALHSGAADYYNLLGPLKPFVEWSRLAEFSGCPTWRGTGMDLGIRDMSSVHAAAAGGCQLPSDIIGHLLREDDLIVEPIRFENGCLIVPDDPGLGVTLDRDALERYRVQDPIHVS